MESSFLVAQIDFSRSITSTDEGGNENEVSNQEAIAVTEGKEIEPKTVKDAECQTSDVGYMFQTRRYHASNKDLFDTDDYLLLHWLPSVEVLNVVFQHVSLHVSRQTQSLNRVHYCT